MSESRITLDKFPVELLDEVVKIIGTNSKDASSFAATCRLFQHRVNLNRLCNRILAATVNNEQQIITNLFLKYPELAFMNGESKNTAGCIIRTTPIDYVTDLGEWHILTYQIHQLLESYSKFEEREKIALLNCLQSWLRDKNPLTSPYQMAVCNYINQCMVLNHRKRREIIAEINGLEKSHQVKHIRNLSLLYIDTFTQLKKNKRDDLKEEIMTLEKKQIKTSQFFDFIITVEAYLTYIENYTIWNKQICSDYWVEVIGFFQQRMPFHYLDQLCDPNRSPSDLNFNRADAVLPQARSQEGELVYLEGCYVNLGQEYAITRGDRLELPSNGGLSLSHGAVLIGRDVCPPVHFLQMDLNLFRNVYLIGHYKVREEQEKVREFFRSVKGSNILSY